MSSRGCKNSSFCIQGVLDSTKADHNSYMGEDFSSQYLNSTKVDPSVSAKSIIIPFYNFYTRELL